MTAKHEEHRPGTSNELIALRPRQAAKALGISERSLWSLTADQTSGIPHVHLGRCVLYPRDALLRWLEDRARCSPQEVTDAS